MREYENKLLLQGFLNIAGVDEAGRGPVAGPVVAAAVILDSDYNNEQVKDSKQLTEKQRRVVYWDIINNAIAYGVGIVSVSEIDETNILEATKQAMKIAISNLKLTPDYILIDAVELDIDTYMLIAVLKSFNYSLLYKDSSIYLEQIPIQFVKVNNQYIVKGRTGS